MSTLGVLLVIPEVYLCAVQCGLVLYFLHFVLVGSTFLILVWARPGLVSVSTPNTGENTK